MEGIEVEMEQKGIRGGGTAYEGCAEEGSWKLGGKRHVAGNKEKKRAHV